LNLEQNFATEMPKASPLMRAAAFSSLRHFEAQLQKAWTNAAKCPWLVGSVILTTGM
jgi:hypothetical protein